MPQIIYKELGETPLEALERFRPAKLKNVPMTYAGRLDPMAEGQLLILIGNECMEKEKYLRLDKEYIVEIVFGIKTDTYDALGMPLLVGTSESLNIAVTQEWLQQYVGKFTQSYPAYSSKTVNGKQLHELARSGELPDEMPSKEVEIYSIDLLNTTTIVADQLLSKILKGIALVST